jgi:hypothetical protein
MWDLTGTTADGRETAVPFHEIDKLVSREQVLTEASRLTQIGGAAAPLTALAREIGADDPLPGIDGIDTWGGKAVELIGGMGERWDLRFERIGHTERGDEVRGLTWGDGLGDRSLAFHKPEAIVADVSGLREINITEVANLSESDEASDGEFTFLEWRVYLGSGTLVAEGESKFEALVHDPGRRRRAHVSLLGVRGVLIGRVLHWMGRPKKEVRDCFYPGRLRHYEDKFPEIAKAYPDVTYPEFALLKPGPTLIFVHGTFACAVPNLYLLHPLTVQTLRYEHDTFLSIQDNADALVDCAKKLPKPDPLYLVAHSRGGLVARIAARTLNKLGYSVVVRTYGTPHLGTPLANMGGRLLTPGRSAVDGVFSWDPVSLMGSLILKALEWSKPSELPCGLDIMRTNSDARKILGSEPEDFELYSYGGEYDRRALADGTCAYVLGEITYEAFGRERNDLVVPTASALGVGTARPVTGSCDHFHYFSNAALKQELQDLR